MAVLLVLLAAAGLCAPSSGADHLASFNGTEDVSVPFGAGGGKDVSTTVSIEKGSTIHSAELDVTGNDYGLGDHPLNPSLNVGDDGDLEWAFNGPYYGKMGRQYLFNGTGETQAFPAYSAQARGEPIILPKTATVTSTSLSVRGLPGNQQNVTIPNAALTSDLAVTSPFNNGASSYRWQAVYSASQMGSKSGIVDRIFMRQRGAIPSNGEFTNTKIYLSHTWKTKDNLSATFASNRDASFTQVWPMGGGSGPLQIKTDGPVIFHLADLEDVFYYDGTRNLLLEIEWSGNSGTIQGLEASSQIGRVWSADSASATGTPETQYGLTAAFVLNDPNPEDVTVDIGDDGGTPEFQNPGVLSSGPQPIADFTSDLNALLPSLPAAFTDVYGNTMVRVPVSFSAAVPGIVELLNLTIDYTYSIRLNVTAELQSHVPPTGEGNQTVVFAVSSQTAGVMALTNLDVSFDPGDLPPQALTIPSTYFLEENTVVNELFDISDYFTDDHQSSWELVYSLEDQSELDKVACGVTDSRYLRVDATVDPDFNGKVQVRLRATDSKGKYSLSNYFNVTVLPVNDPPVITTDPPKTAPEDQDYLVRFNATDPDSAELYWSLGGNAYWLLMGGTTGMLTGRPGNDEVGFYKVYINVTDGSGGSDVLYYTLAVENVNDAPQPQYPASDFRMQEDTPASIDLNQWFLDVDSYALDFRLLEVPRNLTVDIQPNGTADLVPALNWNGHVNLTFIANDSELEGVNTIPLRVMPVDDAPDDVEIILAEFSYVQGGPQPARGRASDGDLAYGDRLNFSWSSNVSGHIGYGEELNLSLKAGYHEITLVAKDTTSLWSSATVKIIVSPTPPPPSNHTDDDVNGTDDDVAGEETFWESNGLYLILAAVVLVLIIILVLAVVWSKRSKGSAAPPKEPEVVDAEISSDEVFKKKEKQKDEDAAAALDSEIVQSEVMPPMDAPDMLAPGEAAEEVRTLESLAVDQDRIMTLWEEGAQRPLPPPKAFEAEFDEGQVLDELFLLNNSGGVLHHFAYQASSVKDQELLASIVTVIEDALQDGPWKPYSSKDIRVGKMSVLVLTGDHITAVAVSTTGTAKFFEKSVNRFVHELESVNEDLLAGTEVLEGEEAVTAPVQSLIGVTDCVTKLVHRGY